jgi:hypothetical protein
MTSKHSPNRISMTLGELVAAAFDEAAQKQGSNQRRVALLASDLVMACLEASRRMDVARRLQSV